MPLGRLVIQGAGASEACLWVKVARDDNTQTKHVAALDGRPSDGGSIPPASTMTKGSSLLLTLSLSVCIYSGRNRCYSFCKPCVHLYAVFDPTDNAAYRTVFFYGKIKACLC